MMGNIDRSKGPNAIGNDWDHNTGGHERDPARPVAEAQIGDQRPQRHHGNQEFNARTGLRHAEQRRRGRNINAINMGRNAGQPKQPHANVRRQDLQCGHKFFAKWHKEQHVE